MFCRATITEGEASYSTYSPLSAPLKAERVELFTFTESDTGLFNVRGRRCGHCKIARQ